MIATFLRSLGLEVDDVVELTDTLRALGFGVAGEDANQSYSLEAIPDGIDRLHEAC
jgi:hypothetical protein